MNKKKVLPPFNLTMFFPSGYLPLKKTGYHIQGENSTANIKKSNPDFSREGTRRYTKKRRDYCVFIHLYCHRWLHGPVVV
jgi:hypothetical protein